MTSAVHIRGLTFDGRPVLRGIDLDVPDRGVLALLGPNGAGKTTTVRIVATLLEPDAGTVEVAGADVVRERAAVRSALALTGQDVAVDAVLTGRENLALVAALRGLRRRAARRRAAELLDRFDLADAADRRVGTWSGGMRRRLDLAAAVVVPPRVLVLDEPTTGLDPRSRQAVWSSFGASTTAVGVCSDLTGGMVDRLWSMDVGGPAFLAGHVAASLARNAVSTLLVLGVALAIGLRSPAGPLGWLGAADVLALFVLALSWFAAALGLLARSTDAANGLTFFLAFLPYRSSAFVALATMPGWLRAFAAHQPATPVIESTRSLLLGRPAGGEIWTATAWCTGLLAASVVLSAVLFTRRTSGPRG
jgi:ABC-2 type transport system permease protein